LGLKYESEKRKHGGDRKSSAQNGHLKTSEKIAKEHGVSKNTVRRAGALVANLIKQKTNPNYPIKKGLRVKYRLQLPLITTQDLIW